MPTPLFCQENRSLTLAGLCKLKVFPQEILRAPEQGVRILCALQGDCLLRVGAAADHLLGTRLAILRQGCQYRLQALDENTAMFQLDIEAAEGRPNAYPLSAMAADSPDYRAFWTDTAGVRLFEDDSTVVLPQIENLRAYAAYPEPLRRTLTEMALSTILLCIAKREPVDDGIHNPYVAEAMRYISENYMYGVGVRDIAQHVGLHPNYLHRLFLAHTGQHILPYITAYRMKRAKFFLVATDASVTQIAQQVGVSSRQYFSRVFKQATGYTPQEYRRTYNITCDYTQVLRQELHKFDFARS